MTPGVGWRTTQSFREGGPTIDVSLDELRVQVEELRASRTRLVAAADAERRRIERDLHDGAQQRLVALSMSVQLARRLVDSDPAAARTLLEDIGRDIRASLADLRELGRAIYPPLLVDRGLADALGAAATAVRPGARIDVPERRRYPVDVEATVYFCCLEALENVARHAGRGARASVRVWRELDTLFFEVTDDGAGFDDSLTLPGAGVNGMRDRVGALGGSLSIASEPLGGVRVLGSVPVSP